MMTDRLGMIDQPDKKARRKSLSGLSLPLLSTTTSNFPFHGRSSVDGSKLLRRKGHRHSSFFSSHNASPVERAPSPFAVRHRPNTADSAPIASSGLTSATTSPGLRLRRKSLLRARRASIFGSLQSRQSFEDDDRSAGGQPSKNSSGDEDDGVAVRNSLGVVVLHHGEVHTTGSMWRKRNHYLVLTDTHLIRFKSQSRASEMFPIISLSAGRTSSMKRHSTASMASLQEMPLVNYHYDAGGIPLNCIVAVYRVEDGRPHTTIEVAYLEERTRKAVFMSIQLTDPQELNLWFAGIRSSAQAARFMSPCPYGQRAVEYVARMLEQERDYDPQNFVLFQVVQRSSSKVTGRASSEDLSKLSPVVCYLAIGAYKVHLVPLQKYSSRSSMVSLNDLETSMSFGLLTLTGLWMHPVDDSFQLSFRVPLYTTFSLYLASVHSGDITLWVRQRIEFLRPLWLRQPYVFKAPRAIADDDLIPSVDINDDYGCFDRTLTAYAAAYDLDTVNIRYAIDLECEDAPCFRLLPPAPKQRTRYTTLELLALMRALRYNESFVSISFNGVNLDVLQEVRDPYGSDLDAPWMRSGTPIQIPDQDRLSLLSQEVRALALKSKRLRRLDFSFCLTRIPSSDQGVRDPGCGIPEAIFPLCRRQLTNVDWVVLNGIKLGESDLDYLVDAASQRTSHLRALEVGNCGLSVHDLDLILSTITAQEATLEAINISGVQGRLSPELFQQQIGYFGQIRKIDLSRVAKTSGPEPLIAPETLLNWRLEELSLSQTAVNQQTVDSVAAYLASERSLTLRTLRLDQCGLTGKDVAIFLRSMATLGGRPRNLHLHVSENRLDTSYTLLFETIAQNNTPTHLSMRMIDFKKEDHFRVLVEAMSKNTSLKYLDISKASLPYDAGPETCKMLQLMFEQNSTLEELDISGEYAHLDVARFGIGLNQALTGLKSNSSLKVLRIEYQKLGLQGANTLASVLEANRSLREVYCENNDINLQSFTVLVNGLRPNKSVTLLPSMDSDRHHSLEKIRREAVRLDSNNMPPSVASSIRRSLHAAMNIGQPSAGHKLVKHQAPPPGPQHGIFSGVPFHHSPSHPFSCSTTSYEPMDKDLEAALSSLNGKWDDEVARLRRYLLRNYNLAHGIKESKENGGNVGDAAGSDQPITEDRSGRMPTGSGKAADPRLLVKRQQPYPGIREVVSGGGVGETKSAEGAPSSLAGPGPKYPGVATIYNDPLDPMFSTFPTKSHHSAKHPTSSTSSRLALPIRAIRPAASKGSGVHSAQSSSIVSTSTGTGSPSVRSAPGLASSSLRKFLSGQPRVMPSAEKSDGPAVRHLDRLKDQPPQIIWSPPKIEL